MSTVKLTIDNRKVEVEAGTTILEAAKQNGIKIPTLCAWTESRSYSRCLPGLHDGSGRSAQSDCRLRFPRK